MTGLGPAADQLASALAALRLAEQASGAWQDDQREALRCSVLVPLQDDGQRLVAAVRAADAEITAALRSIRRP